MFTPQTFSARRDQLRKLVGSGIIVLPGNGLSPLNYPNNTYYMRQDSTFRYYFNLDNPSLWGVLDCESGEDVIFGDDFTIDDIIWTGVQPTIAELATSADVSSTAPIAALRTYLEKAIGQGRKIHYLPPYRGEIKLQLADLLGLTPAAIHNHKSVDLMFAVAQMREIKSADEVLEMEEIYKVGYQMHLRAMSMCREGASEMEISGAIEGISKMYGIGTSFSSIVTQHGETLHNINRGGILEKGRLMLCDAGAESLSGYCSDHTRTYPVGGVFSPKQLDIYNTVLAAHDRVTEIIKPGVMYTDVHNHACTILAEGLKNVGLINGSAEDAVSSGAITMFMPHGLSHGLGMDVHDCEGMGERSFDFSQIADRAAEAATCVHRATWRLREGTAMSDEPGIYFIPALIDKTQAEGKYKGIINFDKLESYRDFGGIRIEDEILVTADGCRMIGDKKIPVTAQELSEVVGK